MGIYAAQGSATDQRHGGCKATFAIGVKKRHLADRVVEILRSLGFGVTIRTQKTWLHVVAGSGPLARMLRDLMGKGAVNKRIPDEILFNVDLSILRSFLDGYASGDAHTTENGRKVQAATVSKVLALQLQLALARFGRLAGICSQKPQLHCIDGRAVIGRSFYLITWRWENRRHERFKVLDRYIATPVKRVRAWEHHGPVASMTTTGGTMLASNAVVHNGLDLQDTDLAIMAMLPYTPGRLIQYEGRFARLGQKRPVLIRYLIAEGTVDEHVASILLSKIPAVERIIDSDEVAGLGRELIGISEEELLASLVEKVIGGAG
jgi:hypothetical protein